MMDLWATVPYYTAYLSKALLNERVNLMVGSITYYLDTDCFSSRGIKLQPGLIDIVGRFPLPRLPRRIFKLIEALINLSALTLRFLITPPDVIHVQYLPMLKWRLPLDLWFLKLCRQRGTRIVLTVHDLLPHDTGEAYKQTFRNLYSIADRIICHSDNIKARLVAEFSVPEEKIFVIPHGPFFYDIAAPASQGILRGFDLDPDQSMVLWQGIIFPYKGIDLLLDAWQHVEAATESVQLLIAGTGAPDLISQIREKIQTLNLHRVKLCPRFISSEELVSIYRAADIVVYPYRAITTSGALATGLALGKTIIASDLPVFRELLTDRSNALLVDPQDTDAFARALIELNQNPRLREQLAQKVRDMKFGDQSWRYIAEKTIHVYENALSVVV